jgi:CheY-like chemotaxis protein
MIERETAQILLVDDEAPIRITLATLLRRCGYTITTAESGEQALAHLEQHAYDLVLLDLIMPGINGIAVAEHVRALPGSTAIIILTGSDALGEIEFGNYAYILKTASPQEVLARIAAVLADHGIHP